MTVSHTVPIPEPEREPEPTSWVPVAWCQDAWHTNVFRPDGPCPTCGQTDRMDATTSDWLSAPPAPLVHYDTDTVALVTACGQRLGDLPSGEDVTTDRARVTCPECLPRPAPVVHYDTDNIELTAACGVPLGSLRHDSYSTDPAAVDCPPCAATLVDGQLAVPASAPAEGFADLAPQIGPAPAVERTVTVEALTDELREVANAAIVADFRAFDRDPEQEPELLPPESRAAVVVRADGQLESVTDVETDAPQRNGAEALAWLMHQAQGRANNLDAELLMPTPDVLAALEGRPVGSYTASIPLRYGDVRPGWQVLTEVDHGDRRDFVWQLIEHVADCPAPADCAVARGDVDYCVVVTVRGRGVQHVERWRDVNVRIPANTEVEL